MKGIKMQQKNVIVFLLVLLLCGCLTKTEYIYVPIKREPITCYQNLKTFLDMAKCLEEYKVKY